MADQEQQVKNLVRLLEGWRVALLPLKSVILWEQQWHPAAIVCTNSVLYLLIWLLDFNILTTLAFFGLIINFVDFIVPIISNTIYGPNYWTGQKEKVFEDICRNIVITYNNFFNRIHGFYSLRNSSPLVYYIISIGILLTLAWLSSSMNNILLFYIVSTTLFLLPGIQHTGVFSTAWAFVKGSKTALKNE